MARPLFLDTQCENGNSVSKMIYFGGLCAGRSADVTGNGRLSDFLFNKPDSSVTKVLEVELRLGIGRKEYVGRDLSKCSRSVLLLV